MNVAEFAAAAARARIEGGPIFVDLVVSDTEQAVLNLASIRNAAEFNCFTAIERVLAKLPLFLKENVGISDGNAIQTATRIILSASQAVVMAAQKETAWVCVRSFLPTSEYDVPRWHCDGGFYEPFDSVQLKFCAMLKGASTLFGALEPQTRGDFFTLFDRSITEDRRREGTLSLVKEGSIKTPTPGHGAFFVAGDDQRSTVHSEPAIREPRLFFSVVPGTEDEIKSLATRWKRPI